MSNTDGYKPVTTDENGEPTKTPQPKVVAAAAGAGVGEAINTIAVYVIETAAHIDLPVGVELAGGILIAAGLAFVAGYVKRPSAKAS